jgi:hypothetical protein
MGDIVLTLTGYEQDSIERRIAELLREQARERLDELLTAEIERAVHVAVRTLTETLIAKEVQRVLEEGWTKTDEWGEPKKKLTTRERINAYFSENVGGYNQKITRLEKLTAELLDKQMRGDLGEVLKEAKAKFRAAIDGAMKVRLQTVLADALGLQVPR